MLKNKANADIYLQTSVIYDRMATLYMLNELKNIEVVKQYKRAASFIENHPLKITKINYDAFKKTSSKRSDNNKHAQK